MQRVGLTYLPPELLVCVFEFIEHPRTLERLCFVCHALHKTALFVCKKAWERTDVPRRVQSVKGNIFMEFLPDWWDSMRQNVYDRMIIPIGPVPRENRPHFACIGNGWCYMHRTGWYTYELESKHEVSLEFNSTFTRCYILTQRTDKHSMGNVSIADGPKVYSNYFWCEKNKICTLAELIRNPNFRPTTAGAALRRTDTSRSERGSSPHTKPA